MGSPVKLYHKQMHTNLGYFATWLPASIIELGDVGILESGRFRKVASLKELGIPHSDVREGTPEDLNYSASAKRSTKAAASVGVPSVHADGGLSIQFTQEGGFIFEALGMRSVEIADRLSMANAMVRIYEQGRWQIEWLVVEAICIAHSATIIVSEDSASEVVLTARAGIPAEALPLADPKVGLTISSSTGKFVHVLAASDLHPLYSCVRVRDPLFFGQPNVVPVRGLASPSGVNALARPAIDDLLDS